MTKYNPLPSYYSIKQQKDHLRNYIRKIRDGIGEMPGIFDILPHYRESSSESIANHLYSTKEYKKAEYVFVFIGKEREVDTLPILCKIMKDGKRLAVPRMIKNEKGKRCLEICEIRSPAELYMMKEAGFHVLEPTEENKHVISPKKIDLSIVPGMAFSAKMRPKEKKHERSGYGAGYYDNTLSYLRSCVPIVALTFGFQIVDDVPINSHDILVDMVITEDGVLA